jgi:hypothetical protein
MDSISRHIKRCAWLVLASGVTPEMLPKFFNAIQDFLSDSRVKFDVTDPVKTQVHGPDLPDIRAGVPLAMDAKAEGLFKSKLSEVDPILISALESAKHGESFVNLLHILGHILTLSIIKLNTIEMSIKDSYQKSQYLNAYKSFTDIWGGENKISASHLFQRFSGKSNEVAIKELKKLCNSSEEIVEKDLLPVLDEINKPQEAVVV